MTTPRHSALVRVTHWLTVIAFAALLVTGAELVISHPRFYWGETGNVNMRRSSACPSPLRATPSTMATAPPCPTRTAGAAISISNRHGSSFLPAPPTAFASLLNGHFRRDLVPEPGQRNLGAHFQRIAQYLRRKPPSADESSTYNVLQRSAYLLVIFVLFPLVIWTGLALSPAFNSAFPFFVDVLGGRQSARTLHFFVSWALFFFLVIHVAMIALSGF